jgi:hypothetical protein
MDLQLINLVRMTLGVAAGGLIGWCFGNIQNAALRRYERLRDEGQLASAWEVMRGSPGRVGFFVISLVAVQLVCPQLFEKGTEWWVSAGVLAAYGLVQWRNLPRRQLDSV